MNKSSLDSILSQYEKNTENNSSKPKISNEERLKKYFKKELKMPLVPLGYFRVKMVILHLMKLISMKDKLMVNMRNYIVLN